MGNPEPRIRTHLQASRSVNDAPSEERTHLKKMEKLTIAVDPGLGGGYALFDGTDLFQFDGFRESPITEESTLEFFRELMSNEEIEISFVLEKVPLYIPGRGPQHASRIGKMLLQYGQLWGFFKSFESARVSFLEVSPQKWQAVFHTDIIDTGEENHKFALREVACKLYPQLNCHLKKVQNAVCDAILIGHWHLNQ